MDPEQGREATRPFEGSNASRALVTVRCLRHLETQQEFPLDRPETLIGRSGSCHIVLDDPLVSRRHAKITLLDNEVVIEDLGSINGLYVNGSRVDQPRCLNDGDRVLLGRTIMVLARTVTLRRTSEPPRPAAITSSSSDADVRPTPVPEHHDGFTMLTNLAEKALAMGKGEEAEKILTARLTGLLASARDRTPMPPETYDTACRWAVRLAAVTGKGTWVDYAVELYTALKRPWPAAIVDELFTVVRKVDSVHLGKLREYLNVLRTTTEASGPTERFLVQRIEGLERVVAAR